MKMKEFARSGVLGMALTIGIGAGALTTSPPAAAQWAVFDPTNYIQNYLQQLRAVQSNINEVKQLVNQFEELRYMYENTKALASGDWEVGFDSINRLIGVLDSAHGFAVSGKEFESSFKTMFPGYKPDRDYTGQFEKLTGGLRDSVMGAMKAANVQINGIQNEANALRSLRSAARSAGGQKQALDAANQIALATIDQLQQMRELMAAQTQIAGTQVAAAAQEAEAKRGMQKQALKYRDPKQGYQSQKVCAVPPCS